MSILQIYVPESGIAENCAWVLRDAGTVKTGSSACSAVPQADQILLIVAASRVLLTQIHLPAVRQGKLRELLAFAVEDKLLTEPDKIHVVASSRIQSGETPVAIIDRAWFRQQLTYLQQQGIHPTQALPETLLPRLASTAWSLVWNGQGGFVRIGPSAGIVVDGGDLHTPPIALTLALEEARLLKTAPSRLLVYPINGASTPEWSNSLNLDIEQCGTWAWQNAETHDASTLNLLQGEFAPPKKNKTWLPQLRPVFVLIGLIVTVQLVALFADWLLLRQEHQRLQNEMVATFKQAFPEATAIVDPALQMRRNLSDIQRAHGTLASTDFLPLLAAAAPVIHQAKLLGMHYEQDQLQIEILIRDTIQMETLREQLSSLPYPAIINTSETTPTGIKAQLKLGSNFLSHEKK